jgi:thiopeptide-type bacteriocin biosynthesis protein
VIANPQIADILSRAAPAFHQKCLDYLQSGKIDPDFESAIFNIINRMTYRSIPYSCFAGVSTGQITQTDVNEVEFASQSAYTVLTAAVDRRPHIPLDQVKAVVVNPTLRLIGKTAQFVDHVTDQNPRYQYSYLALSDGVIRTLKKNPNKLDQQTKNVLLQHGLLWPKEFAKASATKQSKSKPSQPGLAGGALRHELFKPTQSATLSEKTAQSLLKGATALFSIFGDPAYGVAGSKNLDSIRADFQAQYHFKEVPLLDLLSPDHPIGRKFIAGMFENKQARSQLDEKLESLLLDQQLDPKSPIQLDAKKIEELKSADLRLDSFSVVASAVKDENQRDRIFLRYVKGPQLASHFVRYLPSKDASGKSLETYLKKMIRDERKRHGNAVLAEVLHRSDRENVNNISPQLGMHEACIPVSISSSVKGPVEIELSDLFVYLSGERFHLRSKKLNREVMPVITNLHTTRIDSNPIYQFLAQLHVQDSFYELNWRWNLPRASFLPRVEMGQLILSPAMWRLGAKTLKSLAALKTEPEKAKKLLRSLGIPKTFQFYSQQSVSFVDCEQVRSFTSFLREMKDQDNLLIQEAFEHACARGPEGSFVSDWIIPFVATEARKESAKGYYYWQEGKPSTRAAQAVFPPGSEWTYLKVYIHPLQYSEFVANDLPKLVPGSVHGSKENWFFLPYRDPDFHVRIRVQSSQLQKILKRVSKLYQEGRCDRYVIDTYEREISRYGGVLGCQLFERLSALESQAYINLQERYLEAQISQTQYWIYAAFHSAMHYLQSFGLTAEQISQIRSRNSKRLPNESSFRLEKQMIGALKGSYLGSEKERPPELKEIEAIYADLARKQRRPIGQVVDGVRRGKIGVDVESFCLSLIHLSLVRLDPEMAQILEAMIVANACEVLLKK